MTSAVTLAQFASAGYTASFKNRLINGSFDIWQRGTSFSNPANGQYGADRWAMLWGTANRTHSRQAGFDGSLYCYRVQRNVGASDTSFSNLFQIIESFNMLDLRGQTVTLSFSARCGANYSSTGNALLVAMQTGIVADQGFNQYWSPGWTGVTSPLSNSVVLTTTAQRFSFTFTIPSNALEAGVSFQYVSAGGTAGAADFFEVTNVQLELGSVATSFDYLPFSTELILCQRYYEKSYDINTLPGSFGVAGNWTSVGGNSYPRSVTRFAVEKRVVPTMVFWSDNNGTVGHGTVWNNGAVSNANMSNVFVTTKLVGPELNLATTLSARAHFYYNWVAEAEL
jgi:hypothetical protein